MILYWMTARSGWRASRCEQVDGDSFYFNTVWQRQLMFGQSRALFYRRRVHEKRRRRRRRVKKVAANTSPTAPSIWSSRLATVDNRTSGKTTHNVDLFPEINARAHTRTHSACISSRRWQYICYDNAFGLLSPQPVSLPVHWVYTGQIPWRDWWHETGKEHALWQEKFSVSQSTLLNCSRTMNTVKR